MKAVIIASATAMSTAVTAIAKFANVLRSLSIELWLIHYPQPISNDMTIKRSPPRCRWVKLKRDLYNSQYCFGRKTSPSS